MAVGAWWTRLRPQRAGQPLAIALVCLGAILWAGAVYRPLAAERDELRQRLAALQDQVEAARAAHAKRAELERRLAALDAEWSDTQRRLGHQGREPALLVQLEELARRHGLALTGLRFGDVEALSGTPYQRQAVEADFLGPYGGVLALLADLERGEAVLVVEAVSVSAVEPEGLPAGWVTARLSMTVLRAADAGVDAEGGAPVPAPPRANPFAPVTGGP